MTGAGAGPAASVLRAARRYLGAETVVAAASILSVVVFSRLVAPEQYGRYALAVAAGGILLTLGVEWLQASMLRLVPLAARDGSERVHLLTAMSLGAGVLLVAGVPITVLVAFAPNSPLSSAAVAGWVFAASTATFHLLLTWHQAEQHSGRVAIARAAAAALRLGLGVLAYHVWRPDWTAPYLGVLLAPLLLTPVLARSLGASGRVSREALGRTAREYRSFGLPLMGWFLASQVLNLSDRFLLEWLTDTATVGRYSVAYALVVGGVVTLLQPVLSALHPVIARHPAESHAEAAAEIAEVLRVVLALLPAVLVGLVLFGPDLLAWLVDPRYLTSRGLLVLLAGGIACGQLSLFLQKSLEIERRTPRLLREIGWAAGLNLALNLALIPRWGAVGAATATFAAYLFYLARLDPFRRMRTRGRALARTGLAATFASSTMVVTAWAGRAIGGLPWFVVAVLSTCAYLIALETTGARRRSGEDA